MSPLTYGHMSFLYGPWGKQLLCVSTGYVWADGDGGDSWLPHAVLSPVYILCEQPWVHPTRGQNLDADTLAVPASIVAAAGSPGSSGTGEALQAWLCVTVVREVQKRWDLDCFQQLSVLGRRSKVGCILFLLQKFLLLSFRLCRCPGCKGLLWGRCVKAWANLGIAQATGGGN